MLLYLPQASGPPLPPMALGHLLAVTSLSPPLMTTRQCSLEGTNQHVTVESMTVIFWISSQWYAQRDCDDSVMHSVGGTELSKCYQMKVILHCETECLQVPFTEPQLCVCVLCQIY